MRDIKGRNPNSKRGSSFGEEKLLRQGKNTKKNLLGVLNPSCGEKIEAQAAQENDLSFFLFSFEPCFC